MLKSFTEPYRIRTTIRKRLPDFLIDLGICNKGIDCEAKGGSHEWYNIDHENSGCYHCQIIRKGQLWKQ